VKFFLAAFLRTKIFGCRKGDIEKDLRNLYNEEPHNF
jgi:hypothetical protein